MLDRINIRLAALEEAEELAKFINTIYVEKDNENPATSFRKEGCIRISPEQLKENLQNSVFRLWVALDSEQQIAGVIALTITQDPLREAWFRGSLGLFAIHPFYRSKGLGNKMREHIEHEAKKLGVKEILADVVSTQGNLFEYYKKAGFFATGTLDQFSSSNFKTGEITLIHFHKKL